MRMTLILELDLIETESIMHDSGSPMDITVSFIKQENEQGFKTISAFYKFESEFSPNTLTEIVIERGDNE